MADASPAAAPQTCAAHPGRGAAAVCARCGAAACPTCLVAGSQPPQCRTCDERANRPTLAVGRTLRRAFGLYRRGFAQALTICTAVAVPLALVDLFAQREGLGFFESAQLAGVAHLFVGTVATVALARLYWQIARNRATSVGGLAAFGLRRWPSGVAVQVVTSLIIAIGLILLVIPGLVAALNFSLCLPLLAATRLDANQILRRSRGLVAGDRTHLFWIFCAALVVSQVPATAASLLPELAPAGLDPLAAGLLVLASNILLTLFDAYLIAVQVVCLQSLVEIGGAGLRLDQGLI